MIPSNILRRVTIDQRSTPQPWWLSRQVVPINRAHLARLPKGWRDAFPSREENKFFFYDNFYGDGKWNVNQIYFLFRSQRPAHGRSKFSARKVDEKLLEITLYDVRRISVVLNQTAERKNLQLQLDNPIRPSSGTCVSGTNQATTFAAYLIETTKKNMSI